MRLSTKGILLFASAKLCVFFIFTSCNINEIVEEDSTHSENQEKTINLSVNVPKKSVSTYSIEDGNFDENHIDTLFIDLFENGTLKDSRKFFDSDLKIEDYTNDSIINIAFETGNLSNGTVIAEVYANRKEIVPITSEIVFPDRLVPSTCFLMSGTGGLTYNNGTYSGTIHITRNVAKLRTLVSKNTVCIPSNLIIDYQNIKIEAQQVSDRTQLLAPPPILTPSGLNYINYAPRTGLTLRPQSSSVLTNGGQIDSMYLNENYLINSSYTDANITQIKLTIPTREPGMPTKTAEYTYKLYTNGSYQINRNYIYILNVKVVGQSLDPLISLELIPWDDIDVNGDIYGSTLVLNKSSVTLTPLSIKTNCENINYNTDNTSITLDWSSVNPAYNIDMSVQHMLGMNGEIEFFWNDNGAPDFDFKDTVYIKTGNIVKAVELVYNSPKGHSGNWVGTFHRWNQTGERLIKMRNNGAWTATVTQGAGFIVIDGLQTTDSGLGSMSAQLGNDAGFDTGHPVSGNATTLSGSGLIYFRVGLKSSLANFGANPRYGVIEITTSEGVKKIYVRQGDEADYLMRPQDFNPMLSNGTRPYAVKFSPFNLADPNGSLGGDHINRHYDMPYGGVVFDSNKFTEYPSQSGYFFQWNLGGGTVHKAIHPTTSITAISGWPTILKGSWDKNLEPCPAGYRHPNDSMQSLATSEIRHSLYQTPSGLSYGPGDPPPGIIIDNSTWGFYADGFSDRRSIGTSPNGTDSTTVSFNPSDLGAMENKAVAYAGILVYNPTTNASLFFPAAGQRSNTNGTLSNTGVVGSYWTSTYNSINGNFGWAFSFSPSYFFIKYGVNQSSGLNIRCVKSEFGLPGSL